MQGHYIIFASIFSVAITSASLAQTSDEFDQEKNFLTDSPISPWSILGGVESSRATTMEASNGKFQVIPQQTNQNAWFEDSYGPLIYQNVTGNFAVMTTLQVTRSNDQTAAPSVGFNAGGFVIRDAAGTHTNNENWVMYNMGGQGFNGVTYAREVKKTVNSTSHLFLTAQTELSETLLVCRVGAEFRFYHWAESDNGWREEQYYNNVSVDGTLTTTWDNNKPAVTPEITEPTAGNSTPLRFNHPIMPATVQVGIMGHTWSSADMMASFDYVRFSSIPPTNAQDCLDAFPMKSEQAPLTAIATPNAITVGATSVMSTSGGSGTGEVSYALTAGRAFCSLSGNTLTALAVGSCTVTATKAGDDAFLATSDAVMVTVANAPLAEQAPLTVIATPSSITVGGTSAISTSGGSGTGEVSYALTAGGAFCSLSGNTLTAIAVGSCTVTATKAGDDAFLATSDAVMVTTTPNTKTVLKDSFEEQK